MARSAHPAPPTVASQLRRHWLESAFDRAGIDALHWQPQCGVNKNRRVIERVYEYYGRLYLDHPHLEWAGMANVIGPSFYAGFLDIGFLPDETRRVLGGIRRYIGTVQGVERAGHPDVRPDGNAPGELGFYEGTFLTMQRKIFEDQALMHEAYLCQGLAATRALAAAGVIDGATAIAWEQIDSGVPERIHAGNRTLLYREQHDIIDRFYVDMYQHRPPSGWVFTYLLTLVGAPAIPGAKGFCNVFPFTVGVRLYPERRLGLRTPFAAGNLTRFTDRWNLIETDTLPAYRRLIATDPSVMRSLVERPVAQRAGRFRLTRRTGRIARSLITRWHLGYAPEATMVAAPGPRVRIDLTAPSARDDAGRQASDSRIWTNLDRHPFEVNILLPGRREFCADAVLVVLLGNHYSGDPARLTVKLPPADLEGTLQTLNVLARTWRLDRTVISAWAARARMAATDTHVYSTRVFSTDPIGHLRVEFQVEHHIEQDTYIIDALFSWDVA